jgi:hypothetical protein
MVLQTLNLTAAGNVVLQVHDGKAKPGQRN